MEFNEIVVTWIYPILIKEGFQIIENRKNYLHFKSDNVGITISRNQMENSNMIQFSLGEKTYYSLDEKAVKYLFDKEIKIDAVSPKDFISNLTLFLQGYGRSLLAGDKTFFDKFKDFVHKNNKEYTDHLTKSQILNEADKAWNKKNYSDFIKFINFLDKESLSRYS